MTRMVDAFRQLYCSTIGYDLSHIFVPEERKWLRQAVESGRFRPPADPIDPVALLDRLSQVEAFERFLHRTFPGKTRFSIEGLDMLVPILDEVIGEAAEAGIGHALVAMAHRGRLNVMAHVLCKPYEQILAEFKDPLSSRAFREDMAWAGDVKYHAGAHRAIKDGREIAMEVSMPPNPSHLEAVDPVAEGMARAAGTDTTTPGAPRFDPARSVPILIHGDAAFPGQGIVAETLNLGRLQGYDTGGTPGELRCIVEQGRELCPPGDGTWIRDARLDPTVMLVASLFAYLVAHAVARGGGLRVLARSTAR